MKRQTFTGMIDAANCDFEALNFTHLVAKFAFLFLLYL